MDVIRMATMGATALLLCVTCVTDIRHRRVPNAIVVALTLIAVCCWIAACTLGRIGPERLLMQLAQAFCTAGALWMLDMLAGTRAGRDALGAGDIKLAFALVLFLDAHKLLIMLAAASAVSLAWAGIHWLRTRDNTFPFAPSLCIGFILACLA